MKDQQVYNNIKKDSNDVDESLIENHVEKSSTEKLIIKDNAIVDNSTEHCTLESKKQLNGLKPLELVEENDLINSSTILESEEVFSSPSKATVALVVAAALESARNFNSIITGKTDEIVKLSDDLLLEVRSFQEARKQEKNKRKGLAKASKATSFDFAAGMMPILPTQKNSNSVEVEKKMLCPETKKMFLNVENALLTLQKIIQELQSSSVQTEIGMIHEVKKKTGVLDRVPRGSTVVCCKEEETIDDNIPSMVSSTSRIYTQNQLSKLKSWYKFFPRPFTNEVDAMHQILNMRPFVDSDLQPTGLSVKHVRAWFDKRRALERHHYMKKILKDNRGKGLNAAKLQKLKTSTVQKSKELQEEKINRLRSQVDPEQSVLIELKKIKSGETVVHIPHSMSDSEHSLSSGDDLVLSKSSPSKSKKRKSSVPEVTKVKIKKKSKAQKSRNSKERTAGGISLPKEQGLEILAVNQRLNSLLEAKPESSRDDILQLVHAIDAWKCLSTGQELQHTFVQLKTIADLFHKDTELYDIVNSVLNHMKESFKDEGIEKDEDETTKFTDYQLAKLESFVQKNSNPTHRDLRKLIQKLKSLDVKHDAEHSTELSIPQLHQWFQKRLKLAETLTKSEENRNEE